MRIGWSAAVLALASLVTLPATGVCTCPMHGGHDSGSSCCTHPESDASGISPAVGQACHCCSRSQQNPLAEAVQTTSKAAPALVPLSSAPSAAMWLQAARCASRATTHPLLELPTAVLRI